MFVRRTLPLCFCARAPCLLHDWCVGTRLESVFGLPARHTGIDAVAGEKGWTIAGCNSVDIKPKILRAGFRHAAAWLALKWRKIYPGRRKNTDARNNPSFVVKVSRCLVLAPSVMDRVIGKIAIAWLTVL